jgi:phosphate transport system substrate-binding protein
MGAGDDVRLETLKQLANVMRDAERLSLTFRFEDGSSTLDANSRDNLTMLARMLATNAFRGEEVILVGFSDGSGNAEANLQLSESRAMAVLQSLTEKATDLPPDQPLPGVMAFGEALPMACDTTAAGRRANRRVEVWLRPKGATDSQTP